MATHAPGCAGTTFTILKPGKGQESLSRGAKATVVATGKLASSDTNFWSSTLTYDAGVGQVIKGWDQGMLGMLPGEEREIIIPGHEAYGKAGMPTWGIGPDETLIFTVMLVHFVPAGGKTSVS